MDIGKVVLGAIGYVVEYRRQLFKALAVPFLLYTALDATSLLTLPQTAGLILWALSLVVHTLFAVTTHRIILLGPKSVPSWGELRWTKRESAFTLYGIVLGLLSLAVLLPVMSNMVTLSIATLTLLPWLWGRLSLVFPALAIDRDFGFKDSWKLTRHHQFKMIFVVAVFPLLLSLPIALLGTIPYSFLLVSLLSTLTTVFTVAALSVAYKVITATE